MPLSAELFTSSAEVKHLFVTPPCSTSLHLQCCFSPLRGHCSWILSIFCLLEHLLICCYALSCGANGWKEIKKIKKANAKKHFFLSSPDCIPPNTWALLFHFFLYCFFIELSSQHEQSIIHFTLFVDIYVYCFKQLTQYSLNHTKKKKESKRKGVWQCKRVGYVTVNVLCQCPLLPKIWSMWANEINPSFPTFIQYVHLMY